MKKKLLRNWGLKLISLVIAFMLWYLAVSTEDPKETRNFSNIPVVIRNAELLEQENKVYEVQGGLMTRVSVRAPRSVFEQLRTSDIVAEADMNMLTDINTIAIACSVPNYEVESVSSNPAVLKLNIEEKASRGVRVQTTILGEVAEGYVIVGTRSDENRIQISGPKSLVEKVSYADLSVDVSGATGTQTANAEIALFDAEGNPIESESVHKTVNQIRVEVEILSPKDVPIELHYSGEPAQKYMATGKVSCDPETVKLAGPAAVLSNVTKIVIPAEDLDITNATGNVEKVINLRSYLPGNTRFADDNFNGRVTATVYVEPLKEKTLQIPEVRIALYGVPEGLVSSYVLPGQSYRLTVSGLNDVISALDVTDVSCVVDIEEWMKGEDMATLAPGVYSLPVKVTLPKNVTAVNEINVRLKFEEEDEEDGEVVRD